MTGSVVEGIKGRLQRLVGGAAAGGKGNNGVIVGFQTVVGAVYVLNVTLGEGRQRRLVFTRHILRGRAGDDDAVIGRIVGADGQRIAVGIGRGNGRIGK